MATNEIQSFGQIELIANQSIGKIFDIVRSSFDGFVSSVALQGIIVEDDLSQELFHQFQQLAEKAPFYFSQQNREKKGGQSPSNDLAAYRYGGSRDSQGRPIPVLRFEAKRLDSSLLPKVRRKEYVIGNYTRTIVSGNGNIDFGLGHLDTLDLS